MMLHTSTTQFKQARQNAFLPRGILGKQRNKTLKKTLINWYSCTVCTWHSGSCDKGIQWASPAWRWVRLLPKLRWLQGLL